MKYVHVAVKVILEKNGKFLLIQRAYPPDANTWDAPGGQQEFGETLEECGIREVKEEIGLDIKLKDFVGFTEIFDPKIERHTILIYYFGKISGGDIILEHEVKDVKWVSKQNILKTKNLRPALREVWKKRK